MLQKLTQLKSTAHKWRTFTTLVLYFYFWFPTKNKDPNNNNPSYYNSPGHFLILYSYYLPLAYVIPFHYLMPPKSHDHHKCQPVNKSDRESSDRQPRLLCFELISRSVGARINPITMDPQLYLCLSLLSIIAL